MTTTATSTTSSINSWKRRNDQSNKEIKMLQEQMNKRRTTSRYNASETLNAYGNGFVHHPPTMQSAIHKIHALSMRK